MRASDSKHSRFASMQASDAKKNLKGLWESLGSCTSLWKQPHLWQEHQQKEPNVPLKLWRKKVHHGENQNQYMSAQQQPRSCWGKVLPLNHLSLLPFLEKIPLFPRRFIGMMKCWADLRAFALIVSEHPYCAWNSHEMSRIKCTLSSNVENNIGQMAIAIILRGFNDFGCSVTPIFLLMGHILYQFSTFCEKMKKVSRVEVSVFCKFQNAPWNSVYMTSSFKV